MGPESLIPLAAKLAEAGVDEAEEAAKQADGLMTRLLGPSIDEIGKGLALSFTSWRAKKYIKVTQRVQRMLDEARISPQHIPPRALIPAIEAATLEEDDSLIDQWAALLANAAAGVNTDYLPSFTNILKQLSTDDATILDQFNEDKLRINIGRAIDMIQKGHYAQWLMVYKRIGVTGLEISVMNLRRLGLILDSALRIVDSKREFTTEYGGVLGNDIEVEVSDFKGIVMPHRELIEITALGRSFRNACTPPAHKKPFP